MCNASVLLYNSAVIIITGRVCNVPMLCGMSLFTHCYFMCTFSVIDHHLIVDHLVIKSLYTIVHTLAGFLNKILELKTCY